MFPALRSQTRVFLAWHLHAETVAPGTLPTPHTRVVKGEARRVVRRAKKLVSNGAKQTGTVLLKLAYKGTERLVATPALWTSVVMTDTGVAELPPVYTNGRALGQERGVTDRTIRTHMSELKKAGLITRYKYRGTNASYCVWVNPNFVWETAPAAPKDGKTTPSEVAFLGTKRNNLPHTELLESTRILKADISQVDKLVTHEAPNGAVETGIPLTGIAGPQRGAEPAGQAAKAGAGGAGAARGEQFYQKAAAAGTGAKKAEAKRLVNSFWSYAKGLIYKGKTFTAEAERLAKNAIWHGVFHGFHAGEPADWHLWLKGLQRRVELAADWFARNPGFSPSAPYAEVVPGCGYFDAGNEKFGFARTEAWWRTEQARREQGALERALDEAVAELDQRRRLDAGQRRVQASKRAKQKEMSELHRFHHTKLRRLAGDEGLARLAARLEAERLLRLS